MTYIILVLVYLIGGAGTFARASASDAALRRRLTKRVGPLPPVPKFSSYLFCYGLLWPLTVWFVAYNIWQEGNKQLDRSAWMFCGECNIKWRPTGYGPPAPDDRICPQCASAINVQQITDNYDRIPKYGERNSNEN